MSMPEDKGEHRHLIAERVEHPSPGSRARDTSTALRMEHCSPWNQPIASEKYDPKRSETVVVKKHVSTLGIGALSLLIIVSTATSAQANPSPSPTPPTEEQAFETDAIALQTAGYNMTPEDVRRSNEFNKLAAEMYLDFPDD